MTESSRERPPEGPPEQEDATAHRRLPGAYHDSLVLLQLQRRLETLPGVTEAAAVMATAANRALLAERRLLPATAADARPDDLLVVVRAAGAAEAEAALGRVEELLADRGSGGSAGAGAASGGVGAGGIGDSGAGTGAAGPGAPGTGDAAGISRPRSLAAAFTRLPEARWVLVSVPGRWAAGVARDALAAGRNVFLFSDNVPVAEEVALKAEAARRGLLVLGPDCGTAWIAGTGLGFANRVRRGTVGLVAASGSGLQAVACGIHARGGGISHALGTGGRDLSQEVGGATAVAALDLLARDPETEVIVLASKPPAPRVAAGLLAAARETGKPVVVWLIGQAPPERQDGDLWFAGGSGEAAELAVRLAQQRSSATTGWRVDATGDPSPEPHVETAHEIAASRLAAGSGAGTRAGGGAPMLVARAEGGTATAAATAEARTAPPEGAERPEPGAGWLRALFSGGTLGFETLLGLAPFLDPLASNLRLPGVAPLPPGTGRGAAAGGSPGAAPGPGAVPAGTASVAAHTLVDLGADELTAGRPHPMLDPALLVEHLRAAAAEGSTRLLLFDVVLGDGTHPDPAAEIAPALAAALAAARAAGRRLDAVALLVGTDEDPQDLARQRETLATAGAVVVGGVAEAVRYAAATFPMLIEPSVPPPDRPPAPPEGPAERPAAATVPLATPVPLAVLAAPLAAVTVGLAPLHAALLGQRAAAVAVDWRPPAGGDERLARILERAKGHR